MHMGACNRLSQLAFSDDDCSSGAGNNYAAALFDYPVLKDQMYFFEWDSRWSTQSFQFDFSCTLTQVPKKSVKVLGC